MSHKLVHRFGRVEAIRYGDENGNYDEGATARIAQFVLGHDIDKSVTSLNERLMSVVNPIDDFWDPSANVADIVVTDHKSGIRMALSLGQWLARYPSGMLRPIPHNEMIAKHFPPPPAQSFEHELMNLLNKHGKDAAANTSDAVLANYLAGVLGVYTKTIIRRAVSRGEPVDS